MTDPKFCIIQYCLRPPSVLERGREERECGSEHHLAETGHPTETVGENSKHKSSGDKRFDLFLLCFVFLPHNRKL